MKKYLRNFKFLTLALGLMLIASFGSSAFGQTLNDYRSVGGNWGTLGSWERWNGAWVAPTPGEGYPGQFNSPGLVTILDNDVITLNVSPTNPIGALTIAGGANATTLTFTGTNILTAGAVTINPSTASNTDKTLAIAAGTLICSGVTMADVTAGNAGTDILLTVTTGTLTVNGSIVMNGSAADENFLTLADGNLNISGGFTGLGTFSNNTTSAVTYNGAAQTVRPATYGDLILSGSGAKTTTGVTVNTKLTVGGTATVGNAITYATAILEYNGSAAQTVSVNEFPASTAGIDELIINNASGVTIGAAKTFNGANLTLSAGTLATGTNLTMGAAGTPLITVDAGSMTGTLQGGNDYDVDYTGVSKTTGAELSGTGLRNIDLDLTAVTDVVTLDQNRTPDGDVTLNTGTLDLSTFTLNRSAAGGTFNVTNSSKLIIRGTNSFPSNYTTHTMSNTDATIEYAGTAQSVTDLAGGDNFTILILSGSGVKTLAAGIAVDVLLSIQGTATTAGTAPTYAGATILEYKGSAAQTTSNIEFSGTSGTNPTNLRIDNTAGVTLLAAKTINGALTLTNGYLTTTTGTLLSIGTGGSASTANGAFVNGPLAKLKNTTALFTFPVGNLIGGLRTIGVTPSGIGAATYQASFLSTDPRTVPLGNVLAGGITQISACEYWNLAKTAGATSARVSVSWPAVGNTCGSTNWGAYVGQISSLRVGHHDGAGWQNEGQVSFTGTAVTGGTITSTNFLTTFSPFVLASTSSLNALPVTFDDVKAFEKGTGVQIEWSNLTEKDVLNYEVERSANGRDFTAISQLASRSNLSDKQSYLSFDGSPLSGTNYYRIKVVEIDGKIIYSKVLKVDIGKNVKGITLYPNPVTGSDISIGFTAVKGQYTLRVVNNAGQQVFTKQIVHPGGNITQTVTLPSALKTGVYNLMISGDNYSENRKFIMQ